MERNVILEFSFQLCARDCPDCQEWELVRRSEDFDRRVLIAKVPAFQASASLLHRASRGLTAHGYHKWRPSQAWIGGGFADPLDASGP